MWQIRRHPQIPDRKVNPVVLGRILNNPYHQHRLKYFKEKSADPEQSYYSRCLDKTRPLWYRCIWMVVLIASICICIFQITDRLSFYLSDPVTTDIAVVTNGSVKYPSITLCTVPDNTPKLFRLREELFKILRNVDTCKVNQFRLVDHGLVANYSDLWNSYLDVHQLNIQISFFSSANFKFISINHTEKMVRTNYGDCVTIGIPEMVVFSGYEVMFGIQFSVANDRCNYMPANDRCNYMPMAAYVYAHDDSIDPKYRISFFGTGLFKSQTYYLKMSAKHFHNLNVPWNPCTDADTFESCYKNCADRAFQSKLTCRTPVTEHLDVPDCRNSTDVFKSITEMVTILKDIDPYRNCDCKRRCTETIYEFDLQYLMMSPGVTNILPTFNSNTFEIITEKRLYSLISLICDAGGNCGLFLGLCILSILDGIIEAIILYAKNTYNKN